MTIKYEKPKGSRIKRYFIGIETKNTELWWDCDKRKWFYGIENKDPESTVSNHVPCNTVRAFRRHLKKHPEIRGQATLINRYIGYNVYG